MFIMNFCHIVKKQMKNNLWYLFKLSFNFSALDFLIIGQLMNGSLDFY